MEQRIQPSSCPACGSPHYYLLGDMRQQCAACRKKYSVGKHKSKLPPQALSEIAQCFWRMVPAGAAAAEMGINSKTVQKYYDLLRRAISAANESLTAARFGADGVSLADFQGSAQARGLGKDVRPLFGLATGGGELMLLNVGEEVAGQRLMTEVADLLGWVYAQDGRALKGLDLDRTHFLAAGGTRPDVVEATFWSSAKKGLVRYHGGFRRNFPLFAREMAFRFNYGDENLAVAVLMDMLRRDRN